MRVLVCGGRDYTDRIRVKEVLNALRSERPEHCCDRITIVEGGARGADSLAREYAKVNGLNCDTYRADWTRHGRGAGSIRNQLMLAGGIDLVIAFPGGRGTADMVDRARKAGVEVREIV